MDNNLQMIGRVVDYIEEHLTEENLSLDRITGEIGYSKYHLHKNKDKIKNRTDEKFLIGVNDYSKFRLEHTRPVFHYIAAAQTELPERIPRNMKKFELPPGRYAVFIFRGKNEHSRYDFAKYGEERGTFRLIEKCPCAVLIQIVLHMFQRILFQPADLSL